MKRFLRQLAFWRECRELGQSIWTCPNFLFLVMGVATIIVMVSTFLLSQRYGDPFIIVSVVIAATLFVFVPGTLIVHSFERVARANRMKSEFVSVVSHQIRSPLSSIRWAVDFLKRKELDEEVAEYIDVVAEDSQQMLNLVNNLLNTSRLEEGDMHMQRKAIDLRAVVDSIVHQLNPVAQQKNITLDVSEQDIPSVIGDETALRIVLTNLVDNAIRYSPKNESVEIRLEKRDSMIRCEVEDHGVGIPKKDQRFIFEKFFRAHGPLKKKTHGSGLGLYIVKKTVEGLGGKVGFQSVEGKGTTFWFELPAAEKRGNK